MRRATTKKARQAANGQYEPTGGKKSVTSDLTMTLSKLSTCVHEAVNKLITTGIEILEIKKQTNYNSEYT